MMLNKLGIYAAFAVLFFVSACAKNEPNPRILLPKIKSLDSAELESVREIVCAPARVSFRDKILTDENIKAVYNCANYDGSLEPLRPLIYSGSLTEFRSHLNIFSTSKSATNIRDLLEPWFVEKAGEKSKIDALLPALSSLIKTEAFQEGLPLLESILAAGEGEWRIILPALADLVHNDRFPDTFLDIQDMFANDGESAQAASVGYKGAKRLQLMAKWLQAENEGQTNAQRIVRLAAEAEKLELPGFSLTQFFDELNSKGVLASVYQSSGKLRGEKLNEKLNADPDLEELEAGLNLTPAEREARALKKLLTGGKDAPLAQLARLVVEFNEPHVDFLPAVSRWVSSHGDKINGSIYDFVAKAIVRSSISKLNIEAILQEIFLAQGGSPQAQISGPDFAVFLEKAYANSLFNDWLGKNLDQISREEFGEKNAKLLRGSQLQALLAGLYLRPEVSHFGQQIVPANKTMPFSAALKKYNNLHRGDRLIVPYLGREQKLESHLVDIWVNESKDSLGESIVVKFSIQLVQSFFGDFANGFSNANPDTSLSQWYFNSTYSNPGTTEFLAAYVFKDFNFLDNYEKNKDWLKDELGKEIFPNPEDAENLRAYHLLIDNIPNIWLYVKSGYSRSSNTLTRAISEKDKGSLIKKYVNSIAAATNQGLVNQALPLMASWQEMTAENPDLFSKTALNTDDIEYRRSLATGSEAMRRVVDLLVKPKEKNQYETAMIHSVLKPFRELWSQNQQVQTTKFMIAMAREVEQTSPEKLQKFLDGSGKNIIFKDHAARRDALRTTADIMRKDKLPDLIRAVNGLFHDRAVKPALDFFAKKYDDGTITNILQFIRRILGIKGSA